MVRKAEPLKVKDISIHLFDFFYTEWKKSFAAAIKGAVWGAWTDQAVTLFCQRVCLASAKKIGLLGKEDPALSFLQKTFPCEPR
jgi:hypothetical protein